MIVLRPEGVARARVHHQERVRPDRLARRAHDGFVHRVTVPPERSPADLESAEALLANAAQLFGQRARFAHQHRRVGPHPFPIASAQQPPHGLSGGFPENVPKRDIDAADRVRDRSAAAHPEGVGMQLLADPLRLERVLAAVERFEHAERPAHQHVVRECGSPPGDAFIGEDRDQRVDAIFRPDLIRPAAFGRAVAQAGGSDLGYSQCKASTRV